MIDQHMVVPAIVIFFVFALTGATIQKMSSRQTAQRQKEAWLQHGTIPEHGLIDDSPTFGTIVANVGLCIIGSYIAIAMLVFQSNPLWVFSLFNR